MITVYGMNGDGLSIPLADAVSLDALRIRVWEQLDEESRCPYWKQIRLFCHAAAEPEAANEVDANEVDANEVDANEVDANEVAAAWHPLETEDEIADLPDGAVIHFLVADVTYRVRIEHVPSEPGHLWFAAELRRQVFRFEATVEAVFEDPMESERVHRFCFHYCPHRPDDLPKFLVGGEELCRHEGLDMLSYVIGQQLDVVSESGGWVATFADVVERMCMGIVRAEEREALVNVWSALDVGAIVRAVVQAAPHVDPQAIRHRLQAYRT